LNSWSSPVKQLWGTTERSGQQAHLKIIPVVIVNIILVANILQVNEHSMVKAIPLFQLDL